MTNGFVLICSGALRSVEQEYLDNMIRCTIDEDSSGDDDDDNDDNVCLLRGLHYVWCGRFMKLRFCDFVDIHCWWGARVIL